MNKSEIQVASFVEFFVKPMAHSFKQIWKWIRKKITFYDIAIILMVIGIVSCTNSIPIKGTYLGDNEYNYGDHSVIIDKRFVPKFDGHVITNNVKVTYWHYRDPDNRQLYNIFVSVFFREIVDTDKYFTELDLKNDIHSADILFSSENRLVRKAGIKYQRYPSSRGDRLIKTFSYSVMTKHFVGNGKHIVIDFQITQINKIDKNGVETLLDLADEMIFFRHNKKPRALKRLESTMEKVHKIFE